MNFISQIGHQQAIRWTTLALLFCLPFERIPSFDVSSITVRPSLILAATLILLSLPSFWRNRRDLITAPWVWLLGFVGVSLLSALLATDLGRGIKVWLFTVFVIITAWAVALAVKTIRLRSVILALGAGAAVTVLFGIYQFFGDLLGLSTSLTGLRDAYTKGVFGFPRIQSTGLEPLYYANYLLIPVALVTMYSLFKNIRYVFILLPLLTTIWLTVSRGAYYALIAMLLISLVLAVTARRLKALAALITTVVVSVALAVGLVALGAAIDTNANKAGTGATVKKLEQQSTNTDQGESVEGRTFSRNYALDLFQRHLLFGVGPGNYGVYALKEHPTRYGNDTGIANNETVELLAETGALGFTMILGFVGAILLRLWKLRTHLNLRRNPTTQVLTVVGLAIVMVGIAIQYQAFSTLYIMHIWAAIGLLIGLTAYPSPKPKS